jgi:arsenate reductase
VEPLTLLFICIGNTCRSPMAEAIARGLGGDRVVALSAGLAPTGRISSGTVDALRHLGYDPDGLASKGLDAVPLEEVDVVISLIGRQGLLFVPSHLGPRRVAWAIPDPYGEELPTFLAVARDLERRITALLEELALRR